MKKRFLEQMNHLVGDPYGHRYLLAVSGGADSCVMAQLFCESGLNFALAHCNFHLRGEDSNQDMQLVQELAKRWNVEIFVKEFDTLALQKDSGKSVEMVARELRYAWFAEIMANYDFLATAHQADDALETTLLNLCRGTGIKGLASIPERNGNIIRPMLVFPPKRSATMPKATTLPSPSTVPMTTSPSDGTKSGNPSFPYSPHRTPISSTHIPITAKSFRNNSPSINIS